MKFTSFIRSYGKSLVSVLVAALVTLRVALDGDNGVSQVEWVQIAIASTGAVLTYVIPIAPQWRWGKTVANGVMAVLLALSTAIVGGLDSHEWVVLALAALGLGGVQLTPATSGAVAAPAGLSDNEPDEDFPDPSEFPDGDNLESTDVDDEDGFSETDARFEEEH